MGALGVIAGAGEAPRRVAESVRAAGRPVAVVALEGFAEAWVEGFPHVRVGLGEIGKTLAFLKASGVSEVTFTGLVRRPNFAALKVDARGASLLPKAIAAALKGDDALLRFAIGIFETEGFKIAPPEGVARDLAAVEGAVGALAPKAEHQADIALGLEVARAIGGFDIGQGAVVCEGLVLAVEAAEGTDKMLARVAELPAEIRGSVEKRRGVLVKVPKPGQDRRIDLPTLGVNTVAALDRAGLAGVAVEAGGALIVDRAAVAEAADAAGVFVWVVPASAGPAS